MPAHITERKIEEKVIRLCNERGLYCRKFASPSNRGVPDRIIVGKGKVMFLELKRPGEQPTALQRRELSILALHGARAVWADSFQGAEFLILSYFFPEADL